VNSKLPDQLPKLVGKTIAHIVMKQGEGPREQLFFVFTDGTYYEFYGHDIAGAGGIDRGGLEAVLRYMASSHSVVIQC
jgi:hypothetical protein